MKRSSKVIVIVMLLVGIFSTNVFAYGIQRGTLKFWTNQYKLKFSYEQKGGINHLSAVIAGAGAWNSTAARVLMSKQAPNTGENIYVRSQDWGNNGWHALCQPPIILASNSSFIKINDYYYNSFKNNVSELVAHEMGHSFRLTDISTTSSLMRSSGYKGNPHPVQDDINGVNSVY